MSIRLPQRVALPDQPVIPAWHLRMALGVSRQVLHVWRRNQAFPPACRAGMNSYCQTAAVADWLRARGVDVQIVRAA